MLAIGGALSFGNDAAYLLISPLIEWGDGYSLLNNGVPPYAFVLFGLISMTFLLGYMIPTAVNLLSSYYAVSSFWRVWAIFISVMIAPYIYEFPKAYFFFQEHFSRKIIYLGLTVFLSPIISFVAYKSPIISRARHASTTREMPAAGVLLIWSIAIFMEIGFTAYFGLNMEMKPLF